MRIITQGHEILKMDDALLIERAGRTCYKSEGHIGCNLNEEQRCPVNRENCTDIDSYGALPAPCLGSSCVFHSSFQFCKKIIKSGHHSVLEHASATVLFVTDRGVTHEMVRHRLCAFSQESTRYCDYCKDKFGGHITFIRPVWCPDSIVGEYDEEGVPNLFADDVYEFLCALKDSEHEYKELRNKKWAPERARSVLPNSLKTEIVVTANFREWRHILNLRAIGTTGKPHIQMQALMAPVLEEFKAKCPAVFGDLNFMEE